MSDPTPQDEETQPLLSVEVEASWTAEIPTDIDPETDLYADEEMEERLAEEIGLSFREDVLEWDVNVESEVTKHD